MGGCGMDVRSRPRSPMLRPPTPRLGSSETIPVCDGELVLGQWQRSTVKVAHPPARLRWRAPEPSRVAVIIASGVWRPSCVGRGHFSHAGRA